MRDCTARGFAAGVAAHGIGAALAFAADPLAGTMAGIAMGLNAVFSSLVVPVLVRLFMAGE
jgi:putative effector of murein hydrolase